MSNEAHNSLKILLKEHDIELKSSIGKGSYSNVRLGYSTKLEQQIAVKIIDTSSGSEYVKRFLPREIEVVRQLNHANVVRVFQIINHDKVVLLVEEFGQNGDLLKRIKERSRIPEDVAKPIFRQLIEALSYLKSQQIVHRDIKCENIFLDRCDNVKLGDFGFARFLRTGEYSSTFCGSKAYVAPEILTGQSYTGFTVDVWSSGIVLYVMVTGVMPYDDRDAKKMLTRMMAHRVKFPRMQLSLEVKTLVYDILHPVSSTRKTYPEMCCSKWLSTTPYVVNTEVKDSASVDQNNNNA